MSDRPAIVQIQESDAGGAARVMITLRYQDARYVGVATGDTEGAHRPRLGGEATLRAVEQVTENRVHLNLEAVATTALGNAQVAMAQVSMHGDEEPLVGSALLEEMDESGATVRAVLDAINRRLAKVL